MTLFIIKQKLNQKLVENKSFVSLIKKKGKMVIFFFDLSIINVANMTISIKIKFFQHFTKLSKY